MINKYFKKLKIFQLNQIKQNYKYLYIFRYNDFTTNEQIVLKKTTKKLNFKIIILKKKLINNVFLNIKGQGSVLIIYGNENINLFKKLVNFKKMKLIYLKLNQSILSSLKLHKILSNESITLNRIMIQPLLFFLYYLKKI